MNHQSTIVKEACNRHSELGKWPRMNAFLLTFLVTSVLLLGYRPSKSSISTEDNPNMNVYEEYTTISSTTQITPNTYEWRLTESLSTATNKSLLLVNGVSFGPLVEARQNEFVSVAVVNALSKPVTIHWHGISQYDSNDQDGTPSIVQYDILPGASFEYNFQVQHSGTFWWHAHTTGSRLDGLAGPFIVHPADPVNDIGPGIDQFDWHNLSDSAVLVGDWYKFTADSYVSDYLDGTNIDLIEPMPDAIQVNGQISDLNSHSFISPLSAKDRKHRYARLRFINIGAIAPIVVELWPPARTMLIVEADATLVDPVGVSAFEIAVGQRYSVLIDFDDFAVDEDVKLKIELNMSSHSHHKHHEHLSKHVLSNPLQPSDSDSDRIVPKRLHVGMLHPLLVPPLGPASSEFTASPPIFTLRLGTMRQNGFTRSTINNASYVPSNTPLIEQYKPLSQADNATGLSFKYSPDILTLSVAQGEEVLLLLENAGPGPHPFHIHGHEMTLLATDTFFYDPLAPDIRPSRMFDPSAIPSLLAASARLDRPLGRRPSLARDTIDVAGHGWALVKIRGGGRGLWAAHCHIAWHELSGMMMVLEVR